MSEEIKRWDDDLSPEARDLFIKMLPNYHERLHQINTVSYTHLDVYKRQAFFSASLPKYTLVG